MNALYVFLELSAKPCMLCANFFRCLAVITLKRGKKEDFAVSLLENPCLLSMLLGKCVPSFVGQSAENLTFYFYFFCNSLCFVTAGENTVDGELGSSSHFDVS